MPGPESAARSIVRRLVSLTGIGAVIAWGVLMLGDARAGEDRPAPDVMAHGAELFAREWLPGDPKGPGGDGLGPVYNETSCIACHHQGGPGGAGPASTNVEILSARAGTGLGARRRGADIPDAGESHPGLRTARSVVLHRFGVDPMYRGWRIRLVGDDKLADMAESPQTEIRQVQQLVGSPLSGPSTRLGIPLRSGLTLSQRNPPALFGAGLIDALPESVLVDAAERKFPGFPEISGRVSRLKDGRIGRFGLKAETPDLREFVLSACANELGLEVPGHHQAASPLEPDAQAKGLDVSQEECDALVAYVRHLPAPAGARPAAAMKESPAVAQGRALFEASGCATCHRARLGAVDGIYSDLLLHDMGPALSDSASYYGISEPGSSTSGVKQQEWRTPPLWGFRDSGPYLHDGRARDLEEAVAFHGGEAWDSARRFFKLIPEERLRVQVFLRSLAPPDGSPR